MTQLYEIHIATDLWNCDMVDVMKTAGFVKAKFFINVVNVVTTKNNCHSIDVPPTGHDLESPKVMFTTKVASAKEACNLAACGMDIAKRYGAIANFEIEGLSSRHFPDYPGIDMKTLPGYRQVPDSPSFENHIIWRGAKAELPSYDFIIDFVHKAFGFVPHQIVDFCRVEEPGDDDVISRVATVYQTSREATIEFSDHMPPKEGSEFPYSYHIGEQVLLVGEPK